jgi:hypothetical protein
MQALTILAIALLVFSPNAAGYSFTEPPVDSPDYTGTYELGQIVFVTWNQTASAWPLVHLRLDPLSATDVYEYGVTYATLIGLSLSNFNNYLLLHFLADSLNSS